MFVKIEANEMETFLKQRGFQTMTIPGTVEDVYGKIVRMNDLVISMRVYTSIGRDDISRDYGEDAIRVMLFWKYKSEPVHIGKTITVKRMSHWKRYLGAAIAGWEHNFKLCSECGSPAVYRKKKKFWGCCTYHDTGCKGKAA